MKNKGDKILGGEIKLNMKTSKQIIVINRPSI